MYLRPLTVIALLLAASSAVAEDSAIRLFAPVPNGPSQIERVPVEQAQGGQAIRLFSPVRDEPASLGVASQSAAPVIRGAVRETIPAGDRSWTVALP